MRTQDLGTLDEIRNGLRIGLASTHNFYNNFPPDTESQLLKRGLILSNYEERHSKYIDYIRNEHPSRMTKADQSMRLDGLVTKYNFDVMEK